MAEINKPKTTDLSGVVSNVSGLITKNGATFRVITLKVGNSLVTKTVNEKFYQGRKADFEAGNEVTLTFEQRIALKTEYVDAKGDIHKHGENNTNAVEGTVSEALSGITVGKKANVFSEAKKEAMLYAKEIGLTVSL